MTQPQVTENPSKTANQLRKAIKIADVLVLVKATEESIKDPAMRRLAEQVAGVPASSETTWAMVAVLLEAKA